MSSMRKPSVSSSDVASLVAAEYDLGIPDACRLMHSGLNDTYAVEIAGQCYALRLHGIDKWWIEGRGDLCFELELLNHLRAEGVPVSYPLPRRCGAFLGRFEISGQGRYFSLFSWAPGTPGSKTEEHANILGQTLASIHLGADRFHSRHRRYALDERTLLDRFVQAMEPTLATDDPADAGFIREQSAEIRRRIRAFDPGPGGWGIIHGDVQELNFHFTPDARITVFDFDLCGYGWRIYDIASYHTRIHERLRVPFLDGYDSVRHLTDADREMIPTIGRLAWIREGLRSKDLVEKLHDPYMSFA